MSRAASWRLVLALLAVVLMVVGGGFLRGTLHGGRDASGSAAADEDDGPVPEPRAVAIALRALDAHGHWGRYTAAATSADTGIARTQNTAPVALDDLARAYRLVGIEQRAARPQALLLPAGAEDGSTEVIRLAAGDALADGIRVSTIGRDSVRFTTPGGTSTLYLYGTEP